jgi:hypothetical protein
MFCNHDMYELYYFYIFLNRVILLYFFKNILISCKKTKKYFISFFSPAYENQGKRAYSWESKIERNYSLITT